MDESFTICISLLYSTLYASFLARVWRRAEQLRDERVPRRRSRTSTLGAYHQPTQTRAYLRAEPLPISQGTISTKYQVHWTV